MVEVFDYFKERNNEVPKIKECIPACTYVWVCAEFSKMDQIKNFVYQIFRKSGDAPYQPYKISRFEGSKIDIDTLILDTDYKIRVAVEYKSGYLSKWSPFKFIKTLSCTVVFCLLIA